MYKLPSLVLCLNRSSVDLVGGLTSGLRRSIIELRLNRQVPDIIQRRRERLERKPA